MNDREKLIELIKEAYCCVTCGYGDQDKVKWLLECEIEVNWEDIADHLIANGVVIQKQGEWELVQYKFNYYVKCTHCNQAYRFNVELSLGDWQKYIRYCPNCGAKMKEVK